MDKKVKWGIVILVGAGLIGWGIYSRLPKANEELAAADKVMTGKQINKRVLNVNAKIIKPQLLTDQIQISGSLMPDEEVDLSFETSGKIVEINFDEGTTVKKGQLGKSERPAITGPVATSCSSTKTCRRPCVPPKCFARTGCRQ